MASLRTKDGYLYLDFRWRGVRCREATRKTDTPEHRAEVRRHARIVTGEIASGTFDYLAHFPTGPKAGRFATPPEQGGPPLYAEYARDWLRDRKERVEPGTHYDEARMLEARILPTLGELRVSELTQEHVEKLLAALRRGDAAVPGAAPDLPKRRRPRPPVKLSNRRVNMIHKLLRLSLDRAVRRGWLPDNPARAVDLLREHHADVDPLDLDEVRTFLAKGLRDDEERRYFTVAFFTGMRPGEQMGLRWDDVDWKRKLLKVRGSEGRFGRSKGKTVQSARDVKMLPQVEAALRAQRKASQLKGALVFPSTTGTPRHIANLRERVWNAGLRRAGLRPRPLYQTKHTFASIMPELGESPSWCAEQLGISEETYFRRYKRFIPNLTRTDGAEAARRLKEAGF